MLCEVQGCSMGGKPVYENDGDEFPSHYYCDEHAATLGYCIGCGVSTKEVGDLDHRDLCRDCAEILDGVHIEYNE